MPDRSHAGSRLEAEVGVMPRSPKERAAARGLRPPYRSELLVIPSQLQQWCQPRGWNGIPGCPALAGSGVSTSRLMTTGSCPLLTTTASQISFGLPLIS